jgi:hypothetical protein
MLRFSFLTKKCHTLCQIEPNNTDPLDLLLSLIGDRLEIQIYSQCAFQRKAFPLKIPVL